MTKKFVDRARGALEMLLQELDGRFSVAVETVHTSGHAGPSDLKRLAAAVAAKRLIPIHTFERLRFPELFSNVELANDGEWIEV